MMYKRAYFLCCATYHLTVALYYAMQVEWKDTEKILVWQNNTNVDVNMDILYANFDQVLIIRGTDLVSYSFLNQQLYKIIHAGWLFPCSKVGKMLREIPSGNIVFLFNDVERFTDRVTTEFGKRNGNTIILVDEGLGTYIPIIRKKSLKARVGNVLCGQISELYIGANKYINCVFARFSDNLPEKQREGRKVVRQNNIFSDEKWMNKLEITSTSFGIHLSKEKKNFLWIGQPLSSGYIAEKDEDQALLRIFDMISSRYHILIKLHPQEDKNKYKKYIEKYDCEEISENGNGWIPVECLSNVLKPDLIGTPLSSAPLGINESYECLYLYPLFGIKNIADKLKEIIAKKSNIHVVNDLDELDLFLNSNFDNNHSGSNIVFNNDINFLNHIISQKNSIGD